MNPASRAQLSNALYGLIFEALHPYETRGFNAHQRAQNITEEAIKACEYWLSKQATQDPQEHWCPECDFMPPSERSNCEFIHATEQAQQAGRLVRCPHGGVEGEFCEKCYPPDESAHEGGSKDG